jgi:hypothetical protein
MQGDPEGGAPLPASRLPEVVRGQTPRQGGEVAISHHRRERSAQRDTLRLEQRAGIKARVIEDASRSWLVLVWAEDADVAQALLGFPPTTPRAAAFASLKAEEVGILQHAQPKDAQRAVGKLLREAGIKARIVREGEQVFTVAVLSKHAARAREILHLT